MPVKSQTAPAFLPSPAAEIPISTHAASTPATPAPAKSPVPSRKQSADNLPKMEDLEIAEEASEDEAPAAAAAPEPSVPTAVEYVAPSDGAEVASVSCQEAILRSFFLSAFFSDEDAPIHLKFSSRRRTMPLPSNSGIREPKSGLSSSRVRASKLPSTPVL